jgi:hypothetical protein
MNPNLLLLNALLLVLPNAVTWIIAKALSPLFATDATNVAFKVGVIVLLISNLSLFSSGMLIWYMVKAGLLTTNSLLLPYSLVSLIFCLYPIYKKFLR